MRKKNIFSNTGLKKIRMKREWEGRKIAPDVATLPDGVASGASFLSARFAET
jgi:hypothetical protein